MSKIKNEGLDQYGAGPFEQQQFGTAGVERQSMPTDKNLEQSELADDWQSVDAGVQRRPEGAGHVLEGTIKTRVGVPGGFVVSRDVQQEGAQQWSCTSRPVVPVHAINCIACHILSTRQTTSDTVRYLSKTSVYSEWRKQSEPEVGQICVRRSTS